jgi:hypothetical protein
MQKWYAAHVVIAHCLKKRQQGRILVWENIVLIRARSIREAPAKAEKFGRENEGDDDGSLRVGGRPAERRLVGVRKLVECLPPDERPRDGTEVSYNHLEFPSMNEVERFADGLPVRAWRSRVPTERDQKMPTFPDKHAKQPNRRSRQQT